LSLVCPDLVRLPSRETPLVYRFACRMIPVGSCCVGFLFRWAEAVWTWCAASCFRLEAPPRLRPLWSGRRRSNALPGFFRRNDSSEWWPPSADLRNRMHSSPPSAVRDSDQQKKADHKACLFQMIPRGADQPYGFGASGAAGAGAAGAGVAGAAGGASAFGASGAGAGAAGAGVGASAGLSTAGAGAGAGAGVGADTGLLSVD
jgi:hypothetical protein